MRAFDLAALICEAHMFMQRLSSGREYNSAASFATSTHCFVMYLQARMCMHMAGHVLNEKAMIEFALETSLLHVHPQM